MVSTLRLAWQSLSLSKQFAIVAFAVLLPGMAVTGWWIAKKVADAVVRNASAGIAISMDDLLSPFASEVSQAAEFSPESRRKLDTLLQRARANKTVVSMKIWKKDGTIMYSTFPEMVGRKFEPSPLFETALSGQIGANFDSDVHVEDANERQLGIDLLEVYAPLRDPQSQVIVGVSEFYANGDQLGKDMRGAATESWLFVCVVTGLMAGLLSIIAVKGGQTIASQQTQLREQVSELKELLMANEALRQKLRAANENVSSINELVLQHVGADLHDGPAQKLSYAAMRLSELRRKSTVAKNAASIVDDLGQLLKDTLKDIRRMSGGLALPELAECSIADAAELAIKIHEDYTGTKVSRQFGIGAASGSLALRNCIYRLVQEGLNNAYKHAGAKAQSVLLDREGGNVKLEVSDAGRGLPQRVRTRVEGLGLRGMQARVDALGGTLSVTKGSKGGTVVKAILPVNEGRNGDDETRNQSGFG